MRTEHDLASVGTVVARYGLATVFIWVGGLKFVEYEVENSKPLMSASPLTLQLYKRMGARKLARLVGVSQMVLGGLIAARPVAPRASALGSLGAAGMMVGTLSFLITTPQAWQNGIPQLSILGEALLKDSVLLGAGLVTAAESLRSASGGH
ncbi:DUF417 family protein [Asanoa sp. NPDC049573]|uniref:DUF417 family protein n=1 Tax=Asanoa sp. NPDC049573 TaxID=3155396 RepID=UPI003442A4D3